MSITYNDIKPQLAWMCAAMIPGSVELGMPSASDVDLLETLLPQALKARPDLAQSFAEAVLTLPASVPADPLATINGVPPREMELLGKLIAGAYFSSEAVMASMNFRGFETIYENVDYDEIMEAIEPIVERGPCYLQI